MNNMYHFLIIFMLLNFTLALLGSVTFGQAYLEFSSPQNALYTLYIGFYTSDFPDFSADPLFAVYAVIFAVIIWGTLLNLFLAIVVESYLVAVREVVEDLASSIGTDPEGYCKLIICKVRDRRLSSQQKDF